MPAPDHGRNRSAVPEPHFFQCLHRFGVILGAGEDERSRPAEARLLLEQLCVVRFDEAEAREQCRPEGRAVRIAHEGGDMIDLFVGLGDRMGLLVVDHLQSMFEPPQVAVSAGHLLRRAPFYAAKVRQCVEGFFDLARA